MYHSRHLKLEEIDDNQPLEVYLGPPALPKKQGPKKTLNILSRVELIRITHEKSIIDECHLLPLAL